jgi:hypothetical protein
MKRMWMIALIGLALSVLALGSTRQVEAKVDGDMQKLLQATEPYMQQNRELTIKYTGYYSSCANSGQLLEAGKKLSKSLGFPISAELNNTSQHPIYSIEKNLGELSKASLQMIKLEDSSSCYLVIRLVTSGGGDLSEANDWRKEIERQLTKLDINGQWNFMVKGNVAYKDMQSNDSMHDIMNSFLDTVDGKMVESYSDQGTLSFSLTAKLFNNFIQSGDHLINLQAALHRNSLTGEMRLTVATPMITAEY